MGTACAAKHGVRIRITHVCRDDVDGVSLRGFEVGVVYEVSATVGSYLIATGCAELVLEAEFTQSEQDKRQFRGNVRRWRAVAADGVRARRQPRSRRTRR